MKIIREPLQIFGLTSAAFVASATSLSIRREESLRIYRRAFRDGVAPEEPWVAACVAPNVRMLREHGTIKFIQRGDDGLETESVVLPIAGSGPPHGGRGRVRRTLCVSSQVGCAMGCCFCETAQMGLMKNLSAADIVGQWHAARFRLNGSCEATTAAPHVGGIDNIVFMGMGEPMDNLDAVLQAVRVFADRNGPAIAPARITVSTVGRPRGILRLAAFAREPGFHRLRLAVSINAPNDAIRTRIMPINRAAPMGELMNAMQAWAMDLSSPGARRRRVLIEYVLIPGVNDAPEHADELCAYLRSLDCMVNVIPYNPRRASPWPAPAERDVFAFVERVRAQGQAVRRRQTMGRSVMAACGQLGNPSIRGRTIVTAGRP